MANSITYLGWTATIPSDCSWLKFSNGRKTMSVSSSTDPSQVLKTVVFNLSGATSTSSRSTVVTFTQDRTNKIKKFTVKQDGDYVVGNPEYIVSLTNPCDMTFSCTPTASTLNVYGGVVSITGDVSFNLTITKKVYWKSGRIETTVYTYNPNNDSWSPNNSILDEYPYARNFKKSTILSKIKWYLDDRYVSQGKFVDANIPENTTHSDQTRTIKGVPMFPNPDGTWSDIIGCSSKIKSVVHIESDCEAFKEWYGAIQVAAVFNNHFDDCNSTFPHQQSFTVSFFRKYKSVCGDILTKSDEGVSMSATITEKNTSGVDRNITVPITYTSSILEDTYIGQVLLIQSACDCTFSAYTGGYSVTSVTLMDGQCFKCTGSTTIGGTLLQAVVERPYVDTCGESHVSAITVTNIPAGTYSSNMTGQVKNVNVNTNVRIDKTFLPIIETFSQQSCLYVNNSLSYSFPEFPYGTCIPMSGGSFSTTCSYTYQMTCNCSCNSITTIMKEGTATTTFNCPVNTGSGDRQITLTSSTILSAANYTFYPQITVTQCGIPECQLIMQPTSYMPTVTEAFSNVEFGKHINSFSAPDLIIKSYHDYQIDNMDHYSVLTITSSNNINRSPKSYSTDTGVTLNAIAYPNDGSFDCYITVENRCGLSGTYNIAYKFQDYGYYRNEGIYTDLPGIVGIRVHNNLGYNITLTQVDVAITNGLTGSTTNNKKLNASPSDPSEFSPTLINNGEYLTVMFYGDQTANFFNSINNNFISGVVRYIDNNGVRWVATILHGLGAVMNFSVHGAIYLGSDFDIITEIDTSQ